MVLLIPMKKVRFETPKKALLFGMDDSECHSPRPFIGKELTAAIPNVPHEYTNGLQFSNDPVQMFECSNISPYPIANKTNLYDPVQMYECSNSSPYAIANKTNLFNSESSTGCSTTDELELSMLDASSHEPRQPGFSKSILKSLENKEYMVSPKVQEQSSIEHTKLLNVLSKDNSFFIRRDNIDKYHVQNLKPLYNQLNELSLNKENNPLASKAELMKMGISSTTPVSVEKLSYVPSPSSHQSLVNLNDSCRCHHCIKITPNNGPYQQCNGYLNSCPRANVPVRVSQNHCSCVVIPKPCSVAAHSQKLHVHATCHCKGVACDTPQNAVDKKTWATGKYEESKKECTDIEKQRNVIKEKREPTVADLFKIIKLQNEQLQLLQEKVDKFFAANKCGVPNIQSYPVQNYVTEHVALETVDTGQHKISVGVMTSFEMVRTSTVINKEVLTHTNENAQIQCNRSHVSIKEVVKSHPTNLNFLEGIMPVPKTVQSDQTSVHEFMQKDDRNVDNDDYRLQSENVNNEKTLNELSLYNVQVDNAITPLMSPEQSLYLDVRDYSDSDSSSDDQSHVGWTYYNKVMTHVNGMLQDSDMPSSASALYRNTRQQCIQMQIDKTNVSVTKRVKFGDDPLGIHQPHIYAACTDTSLKMNQLAAKYLKNVPKPPQYQQPVPRHTAMPVDMSFATRNYMEKHKLLQGIPPSSARSLPPNEMPRFLDITALKQQPKLLYMGKSSDTSPRKCREIQTLLLHSTHSQRDIATLAGVSKSVVNRIKIKMDQNKPLETDRVGKCGRKRITTRRTDRKIRDICLGNRKKSVATLTTMINNDVIDVSERTVRRRLVEENLIGRRPIKKPRLTEAMKKKRLQWARQHRNMTIADWSRVCFSDESTFQILIDKSSFVRRRPGEQFHPDCLVERVKHPASVMVWSVISSKGMGRLYIVEGTMRQDQYKRVLETRLLPQLEEWFPGDEEFVFMHDSAPCHKARSVTEFLVEKNISVLPWPGNSPDMNPIENMWELTKRAIAKELITTKRLLIETFIREWHHNTELQQHAKVCIESMPRRIEAVIAAKGGITKY